MTWTRRLGDLWYRLVSLIRRGAMEREMKEEFAFHLEMEARKLERSGVPPTEAARLARIRFGNQTANREVARDSWGTNMLTDLLADIRHALRQFRRRPGFSLLGIGTLTLGLGATVALGSVVRSVLLRPLPVPDDAGVRVFWFDYSWRGVEFDYIKERTRAFDIATYSSSAVSLRSDAGTNALIAGVTSAELFDVLRVSPALGRTFVADEDRPGAERVAVLSHGMWETELGGDPGVIGRRLVLDGEPATVIGVMPRGFFFPTPEHRLWMPLSLDPSSGQYQNTGWLTVVGRVRPGMTESHVHDDLAAIGRALGERFQYPAAWDKTKAPSAQTLREYVVGNVGPGLLLLLGAGMLILVMACANVAALVLARTTDRTREIALRAALGAGRGRLARQIVTESLVLTGLAGLLGAVVAALGFEILVASLPLTNGLAETVSLDWTAFGLALGLAVLVGLLVAAAPVRDLLRGRLQGVTSERGVRGIGYRTSRIHGVLVATEAAVAVVLVVGAGLLIRSVERLYALDLGFDPRGVMAVDLIATSEDLPAAARARFFEDVVERVAAVPGVSRAGLIPRLPVRDGGDQGTVSIPGRPDLEGASAPNVMFRPVTPDYFAAMGIPIMRGRGITPLDRQGAQPVVVVSESLAELAWPGQDPIGRQLPNAFIGSADMLTVVGVAREIKIESITRANPFVMYVPMAQLQNPRDGVVMVLKLSGSPEGIIPAVRRVVHELEPRIAIFRVSSMDDVVAAAHAEPHRQRFFLTLFAALALVLGVVGIYSVVSYAVVRRRSEFGVRMALGADQRRVLEQVVGRGLLPVGIGTAAGLLLAVALGRVAARFVYGISPIDPASLAVATVALVAAGAGASLVPALRAARVSPVEALRAE